MASASAHHPDEVDRIVADWQRERPDLDVSPLEVLSRLSRLSRYLDLARRRAFADRGLEPWEFDVLSALRRAGEPYQLSAGGLVRSALVTSGTMTNRIDRLAARGLVQRRASATDRRTVLVQLTAAGCEVVDGAMQELLEHEHQLLAALSSAEQQELAGALTTLLTPFDEPPNAPPPSAPVPPTSDSPPAPAR